MVSLLLGFDDVGTFATAQHSSRGGVVETFTAAAFRLEPEPRGARASGRGHVSLDGEDMPYVPIQAEIHPRLLRVYAP